MKIRQVNVRKLFDFVVIKVGLCFGAMYIIIICFIHLITPEAGFIDIVGENVQKLDGLIFAANAKGSADEIRVSPPYSIRILIDGYEVVDSNGSIKASVFDKNDIVIKIQSDHEMRIENLGNEELQYDFHIDDISGMKFSYRNEIVLDNFISLESKKGFLSLIGDNSERASETSWKVCFFPNGSTIKVDGIELEKTDVVNLYEIQSLHILDCNGVSVFNSTDKYISDWKIYNLFESNVHTNGTLRLNINTTEMNYHIDSRELFLHYDDNNKYGIGDENSLRAYFTNDVDGKSSILINGPVDSVILSGIELFPSMKRLFIDSNVPALILASFIGSLVGKFVEIVFKKEQK